MTPIDYIKIEAAVLSRKDLSSTGKMLLGLIHGCNSQGLHISNESISELLGVNPDHVTKIIRSLLDKGLVEIKNPQSRYRRLFYSGKNNGVDTPKEDSTPSFRTATPSFRTATPSKTTDITKKKVKERARKIEFDADAVDFIGITPAELTRWGAAFPGVNLQAEILEAANWLIRKNQTREDYRRYLLNWFKRCKPTAAEPTGNYIEDVDTIEQMYKEAGLC